jgi:conjugative transfer region protein TrbK
MDSKALGRIGAGAFVAVALTMTVLGLREQPESLLEETSTVWVPDGDPLPTTLRACSAMGEQALSSPDCRGAWAEKRRRFLGVDGNAAPASELPIAKAE